MLLLHWMYRLVIRQGKCDGKQLNKHTALPRRAGRHASKQTASRSLKLQLRHVATKERVQRTT